MTMRTAIRFGIRLGARLGICAAFAGALAAMPFAALAAPVQLAQAKPADRPDIPTGAQAAVGLPPDVAYGRFIALIRAHLATGDELLRQRQWSAAQRHLGFPREEIYGVIRADLRTYRTPPFDHALMELVRTVKAGNARQYPKALKKVEDALDAADSALKARQKDWPSFVLAVAVATVKTAPDEYGDAFVKGRIVRPIGYQTARGFILQSDRMIESVAPALEAKNPDALREIRGRFAQLEQAFAGPQAPKPPLMDDAAVVGLVAKIDAAAERLK